MDDLSKPLSELLIVERKLLHFGLDYLTLNICKKDDQKNRSEPFLAKVFAVPHDTDNTNVYYDFEWGDLSLPFRLIFSESPDGEVAQFHLEQEYLFQVAKIDPEKPKWKNTGYKYRYRLQFYGAIFNATRRGEIVYTSLFPIFLGDINNGLVSHSVSRVDICADISGFTPRQIKKGIKGSHRKRMSILGENPKTGEFETFYYGDKSRDRNTWFARAYDKLADSRVKRKERFYSDYFQFEKVTRIELEVHSDTCRLFELNLAKVLDLAILWAVLKGLMKTKYNSWDILRFLEKQRVIYDFESVFLEKVIKKSIPLQREDYAKRFLSMSDNFGERYGEDPAVYIVKNRKESKKNVFRYFADNPQID